MTGLPYAVESEEVLSAILAEMEAYEKNEEAGEALLLTACRIFDCSQDYMLEKLDEYRAYIARIS